MLKARWKQILFGAMFQYVHGMATQLAHRMHEPQEVPLGDLGFKYLPVSRASSSISFLLRCPFTFPSPWIPAPLQSHPCVFLSLQELGLENAWMSETIFWCLFIPFILWSFSPFVTARKRFYTAVIYARILMVLCACQMLRIISFTVTQLPAPNYHCRLGEGTAVREMPDRWWGHVVVDVGRQATHGCGDLIFSSHTTFVLVGVLTFTEYGETLIIKIIAWIGVAVMGLCIVASRKHYSVDVVVAWYTVPLVFYAMLRRWTTKRPVQDYWPHRPLAGEEGTEPAALEAAALDAGKGESGKPLLPVVVHQPPGHTRQGSRSAVDLRSLLGKPPLPPKEPASPPPGGLAAETDGVVQRPPGNGGSGRAQRRQSSISNGHPAGELELRDLESGREAAGEGAALLPGRTSRDSPTGQSPTKPEECVLM